MILIKAGDEGSTSPFIARFFIDMLKYRDQLYLLSIDETIRPESMTDFDDKYKPLLESARSVRDAGGKLLATLHNYLESIDSGETIKVIDGQLECFKNY